MAINSHGQTLIPGIKMGLNYSSIVSDQIESSSRFGIDVGINITTRLRDKLDLISEISYSEKGAKTKARKYIAGSFQPESLNYEFFINSIHWSLIANYYLKVPNLSVQVGPVFGVRNWLPQNLDNVEVFFGTSENIDENINSLDLSKGVKESLDCSLAIGISGGTEAIRVNLRYNLGITDYYKKFNDNGNGYSIKNNFVQLSISYSFLNLRLK